MKNKKTIISQCTPIGQGGIGIIRISGKKAKTISKIILNKELKPRHAEYLPFKNKTGKTLDYGIAIFYKSPNSFTGEDTLELHSHGGQKIIEIILKNIINLNIKNLRIAKPGEFTKRAFINKKIDIIQAESIYDLINAKSEIEIDLAIKSYQGIFSQKIKKIIKKITNLRILIDTKINFPEDIDDNNLTKKIKKKIININLKLKKIYKKTKKGKFIKDGIKITIIGKPNVGKSSLMNYLTNKNNSIVTNIPGTTRDIIKHITNIENINVEINDTAGIHKTKNKIEKIGIKKTWNEINNSQLILFIDNAKKANNQKIIQNYENLIKKKTQKKIKKILIRNKIDITKEKHKIKKIKNYTIINLSVKKNKGLNILKKEIKNIIKNMNFSENNFLIKERNIKIIKKTLKYTNNIKNITNNFKKIDINLDLISENIFLLNKKLNYLLNTKEINNKNILDKIFSKFCIGK